MKNREIDLLIVVNMFLTGFDATTLNTLWIDKNLKGHALLQAYSRTNRILNSVKTHGNIVCFRDLQKETDEAIALFGDKNAGGIIVLKSFEEYWNGYKDHNNQYRPGYMTLIDNLEDKYPLGTQIIGEQAEKEFIRLFGSILTVRNILSSFSQFEEKDIMMPRELQDYQSIYLDLYDKHRRRSNAEKEDVTDDLEFKLELVKQVEVNIDYILMLVEKYHRTNCQDKEILLTIKSAVDASMQLRSKKELIDLFIEKINVETEVIDEWKEFVLQQGTAELNKIIAEGKLKEKETKKFISNSFRSGELKTVGTDVDKLLPPVSRFGGSDRPQIKQNTIQKFKAFFEKYAGLGVNEFK